jgi:UDP-N-acetylglucosamine 2-epimerase (non-hydrolysing)
MKILCVAGARPNFVKIAPLIREMRRHPAAAPILVHTGQHYDHAMSQRFFDELEIPPPDFNLGVGSGSHAVQTAEVMKAMEPVLVSTAPDFVVVVGDVNSTAAAALTAVKMGIRVGHVEAGLRSFDRSMPEEINRLVTDAISDLLFITEESAAENLRHEGIPGEKIHFVGNVMIDALESSRPRWERSTIFSRLRLDPDRRYAVLTLHRPSNVDDMQILVGLLDALSCVGRTVPIIFPVHPRVRTQLGGREQVGWIGDGGDEVFPDKGIVCLDPLGYLDFVALMSRANLVLTDSGGIQEETTILGVPCLTLRTNTERPITVTHGTNKLVGMDPDHIVTEALVALERGASPTRPPLWDGRAAERIVHVLASSAGQCAERGRGSRELRS